MALKSGYDCPCRVCSGSNRRPRTGRTWEAGFTTAPCAMSANRAHERSQGATTLRFTCDGARIIKKYHKPMTPCERLLAHTAVNEATKGLLREQLQRLDPVRLLQQIRAAQGRIADLVATDCVTTNPISLPNIEEFLTGLAEAWKTGEVRPNHRKKPPGPRAWRTRVDPFEQVWPVVQRWLDEDPGTSAKELLGRLTTMLPSLYVGASQLRTLQRRVQAWRREKATELVFRANLHAETINPAANGSIPRPSETLFAS